MKIKKLRYICPLCFREFKTLGWYKRHSLTKHNGLLPYIPKQLIDSYDIQQIFHKINQIEQRIIEMSQNGVILKHDIDIKPIKQIHTKQTIPFQNTFKECMKELKNVFEKGIKLVSKLDDMELGIKTEEEIEQLIKG